MDTKLVVIVAAPRVASLVEALIQRLVARPLVSQKPPTLRRLIHAVLAAEPQMIVYATLSDEERITRWLKDLDLRQERVRFLVCSYTGFNVGLASLIERQMARQTCGVRVSYAA